LEPEAIEQVFAGPARHPQIERSSLMARLASVVKQGYFPAPPAAVAGILRHLKIPDPPPGSQSRAGDIHILDPCAGEARALAQIAAGLGVSPGHAFAVELNARRAAAIAESHPEVRLLGPCSFEANRISRQSLSMVFFNLPFDDEFGGGGRRRKAALPEAQLRTQGVMTVRDVRYCSAAPIERLARLGEAQFRRRDGGWPDGTIRTFGDQLDSDKAQFDDQNPE
jgi:hypothetical protein